MLKNRQNYSTISRKRIKEVLEILPPWVRDLGEGKIVSIPQKRYDTVKKDHIRGAYFEGENRIIIYGFLKREISNLDYAEFIYHEIGHLVFKRCVSRNLKVQWARAREEKFFVELRDLYPFKKLWEEEFCIVFSYYYLEKFLEVRNMKKRAKSVRKLLQKTPKRLKVISSLTNTNRIDSFSNETCVYYQKVHERLKKAIVGL